MRRMVLTEEITLAVSGILLRHRQAKDLEDEVQFLLETQHRVSDGIIPLSIVRSLAVTHSRQVRLLHASGGVG